MFSHLAFLYSGIQAYSGKSAEDGERLARNCIQKLENLNDPDQFPPRLLILLVSPAYLDLSRASNLLNGLHKVFYDSSYHNVPLIGCSTAAVFFDRAVYREGALLLCLASRLLKVDVAIGENANSSPETSADELLSKLNLHSGREKERYFSANRFLLTFLPGFDNSIYSAPLLHQLLRKKTNNRVSIFGGVASADDHTRRMPGILFANNEIHKYSIVAANVSSRMPFGITLRNGLKEMGRTLRVSRLSEDQRVIYSFHEDKVENVMREAREHSPVVLLSELCNRQEPSVDTPYPSEDGKSISLTRQISETSCFKILKPVAEAINHATLNGISDAIDKGRIKNPVGGLSFKCNGLLHYHQEIGLDFKQELNAVEDALNVFPKSSAPPCVGAFVDGEAGVDENGRILLGNWSTSALVFGDEISNHLATGDNFAKLASLANEHLLVPEDSAEKLVQLIYNLGFRGAMISYWMPDQEKETIVAKAAIGSCFKRIKDRAIIPIDSEHDVIAQVVREKLPRFIPDSRAEKSLSHLYPDDQPSIISQYIIPLMNRSRKVNAILQIDLGDLSYLTELSARETQFLKEIGNIVISILSRVFSGRVSKIIQDLDDAAKKFVTAETIPEGLRQYLEAALQSFNLEAGYIRLAQEESNSLHLAVGLGTIFKKVKQNRDEIDFGDMSPLAQAFRHRTHTIINDAKNNSDHQWLSERYKDISDYKAFKSVQSYANISFASESGSGGTITLFAKEPWFFTWHHRDALEALSERIGFFFDSLKRKFNERFLITSSARISQTPDLESPGKMLSNATGRFARAINADFASLFLWDEELQVNILRAQYGWIKPEWVNVARYGKDDIWSGSTAIAGAPRYIPDLYKFYQNQRYKIDEQGRYNSAIFGRPLSADFRVEAIGIPLRLAGDQIGIVVFYRHLEDGRQRVFATIDKSLLLVAAANLTSLVKLLQSVNLERWEKEELKRHQEIYEACVKKDSGESFEARTCRQFSKTYHATIASFYRVEPEDNQLELIINHSRLFKFSRSANLAAETSHYITDAELSKIRDTKSVLARRRTASKEDAGNPLIASTEGLVEQAFIPLIQDNRVIGIISLKWLITRKHADPALYRHSDMHLQMLGNIISSAYNQHEAEKIQEAAEKLKRDVERRQRQNEMLEKEREERSELAVKATGAYVYQGVHRLGNIIQRISDLQLIIKLTGDEEERSGASERLREAIELASQVIGSVQDLGERVARPQKETCCLADLIKPAFDNVKDYEPASITIDWRTVGSIFVSVDPKHTEQIFINLINNSFKAMNGRYKRELAITTSTDGSKNATVSIIDSGCGMNEEQIRAAMRGFVSTQDHKGVGVLISRVLLHTQGGTLRYNSAVNKGTETIITLPLANREE